MMTVQITSIWTYDEIVSEGYVGEKQQEVFEALRKIPHSTDREIAKYLNYPDPNNVRPRRKELFDLGIIIKDIIRPCSVTGRKAITWKLKKLPIKIEKINRKKCSYCNGKGYIKILEVVNNGNLL